MNFTNITKAFKKVLNALNIKAWQPFISRPTSNDDLQYIVTRAPKNSKFWKRKEYQNPSENKGEQQ